MCLAKMFRSTSFHLHTWNKKIMHHWVIRIWAFPQGFCSEQNLLLLYNFIFFFSPQLFYLLSLLFPFVCRRLWYFHWCVGEECCITPFWTYWRRPLTEVSCSKPYRKKKKKKQLRQHKRLKSAYLCFSFFFLVSLRVYYIRSQNDGINFLDHFYMTYLGVQHNVWVRGGFDVASLHFSLMPV